MGAYHSTKNFEISEMGTNGKGISSEKVPENTEIVEFPKSEPFNRKFRKFRDESQMERKFPEKTFSNIWVYLTTLSSFTEFMQIPNFLVLSAS